MFNEENAMRNALLASTAVMTAKRNPETPSGAATLTPGFGNAIGDC